MIFSGHGFVGAEVAAEEWRFAEQLIQKTRGGETAADAFGLLADGEVEIGVSGSAHRLEDGVLALPFEEIAGRRDILISSNGGADDDELVGLGIGERSQQRGVDDAEDSGVGADAEGESEDGDGCEAGIFQEQAESKAGVTQQVHHARALPIVKRNEVPLSVRFERLGCSQESVGDAGT